MTEAKHTTDHWGFGRRDGADGIALGPEKPCQRQLRLLDTPAGSLLITIGAHEDEWDEFLLVAEEILAGISFPDLE